jgi:hypothetical protein
MRTTAPYRIQPPDEAVGQISLQRIPGVRFEEMPRLAGSVCSDMYGDLPYGMFVLPEAEVRGAAGYIYTAPGRPILEQNAGFLRKKKFLRPRYNQAPECAQQKHQFESLITLLSSCHDCFWHWMGDSLPKVLLAEECGFQGSYLIPSSDVAPWALESMQLAGISMDRIVPHNGTTVRASTLCIPTYFCGYNAHHNLPFSRQFRDWVRSFVPHMPQAHRRRILVGRQGSAKARRVVNQLEVAHVALEFGFSTIYFEDLSLREQLALALNSEAIIAPHSSGLTHLLFMNEGSLVVELFPYKRQQSCDCYETLSLIPPQRYRALESETPREGDIEVRAEHLREVLKAEL